MRSIIIILVILAMVIGPGVFFQNMLNKESHELITNLQNMSELVRETKWEEAKEDMTQVKSRWQHIRKKWQAVSDHMEISLIDVSLARLETFLSVQEKKDSLAEIAALQHNIQYIPDKEKLTLTNIF